jgi:membrane fusion protein (multidrug efflux system)
MKRNFLIGLVLTFGAALAAAAIYLQPASSASPGQTPQPAAAPSRPGLPVETAKARPVRSTQEIRTIGSLQSAESVKVAAEVPGRVAEILFREGQPVKADEVLVKLDDDLARAELADAQARQKLAEANLGRANQLARTGSGTERARDEAVAASETGRAAVELARAKLDKHTIRAPFAGLAGLRGLSVGAFVNTGTEVANIESIDPIKVDFSVPETLLTDVRVGQSVEITLDALPGRSLTGTIYAIAPVVDVNGRSLRVRARLPNPDGILRPGLFARIVVKGGEQEVVMIPESAVTPRDRDFLVFRIENGRAVETKVELGARKAGEVEIRKGLSADTVVVTAGQQRLRNGSAVAVVASADDDASKSAATQ